MPDHSWTMTEPATVYPAHSLPVPGVHGSSLEVAVTLQPADDATEAASVLLVSDDAERQPFGGGEAPEDDCCGVAITVSWQEKTLKVGSSCRADRVLWHASACTHTVPLRGRSTSVLTSNCCMVGHQC